MEHSNMPPLTYASYLDLEKLLSLQKPRSSPPEHDETLFIIIHQTYELWFKQLLHEFEKINRDFSAGDLFGAIHTFKRVRTIMKVLVAQIDILETMTPSSFSSFRDRLETASGFQSVQFREIEFALGYKRASTLHYLKPDFPGYDRLQKLLGERSVVDHFYDFLATRGAQIPTDLMDRDLTKSNEPDERVQAEILRLYKNSPECSILLELMTDFDEGLQETPNAQRPICNVEIKGQEIPGRCQKVVALSLRAKTPSIRLADPIWLRPREKDNRNRARRVALQTA